MRARDITLPTLGPLLAASVYSEQQKWVYLELVNSVAGEKWFQERDANQVRWGSSNTQDKVVPADRQNIELLAVDCRQIISTGGVLGVLLTPGGIKS